MDLFGVLISEFYMELREDELLSGYEILNQGFIAGAYPVTD